MIIEFKFKNYKSYKEEAILSFETVNRCVFLSLLQFLVLMLLEKVMLYGHYILFVSSLSIREILITELSYQDMSHFCLMVEQISR